MEWRGSQWVGDQLRSHYPYFQPQRGSGGKDIPSDRGQIISLDKQAWCGGQVNARGEKGISAPAANQTTLHPTFLWLHQVVLFLHPPQAGSYQSIRKVDTLQ